MRNRCEHCATGETGKNEKVTEKTSHQAEALLRADEGKRRRTVAACTKNGKSTAGKYGREGFSSGKSSLFRGPRKGQLGKLPQGPELEEMRTQTTSLLR